MSEDDLGALVRKLIEEARAEDPVTHKPGWKTTEFWVHLVLLVAGIALGAYGATHENTWLTAIGAATGLGSGAAYSFGRSLVKKPPRLISSLLLAFTLTALTGCNSHQIDADACGPLIERVCNRHDELLKDHPPLLPDGSVDTMKLETYLESTQDLRGVVRAAQAPLPDPSADSVATHDDNPNGPIDPCNWEKGKPCGYPPENGPCSMPCAGCCPHGCHPPSPAKPVPR